MSATLTPFGLKPAWSPSGVIRQSHSTILSGYPTNIFQYSPVLIAANGSITEAVPGSRAIGVFLGVEWTDTRGIRQLSNNWIANTVATEIIAYYTFDPTIVYQLQADATVALDGTGQQYDWTALTGNAITGLSSVALDVSTAAANAGLRVIGLNPDPDNEFGDAFPVLQVQFSQHQYVADIASV